MDTYTSWMTGRPILSRLPQCYQDNPVADYLTAFYDDLLVSNKATIDDLPRNLNPTTCDAKWLDVLAPVCGFTSMYWDTNWPTDSKRTLLASSFTYIWPNKGSAGVLNFVLNALHIDNTIWTGSSFVLGASTTGSPLGSAAWEYKILLPVKYATGGYEFKLANKINNLFGPLWCRSSVVHDIDILPNYTTYSLASSIDTAIITEDGFNILL